MSWKTVKLGKVLKQYRIEHWVQNDKMYKQVSILNDGSVVLRGEKIGKDIGRKRQFIIDLDKYPNTLIFTRQLLLQGSIGMATNEVSKCIVTENMPMFSVKDIEPQFLFIFLKSELFKSQVRGLKTSGTAQKSLHERQFLELEIPLPSFSEQLEIIERFRNKQEKIEIVRTEITQQQTYLQLLRQTILQEAVQGKLTKQDPTDEPATQLLKRIKAEKEKLIKAGKLKKEKELPPITEYEIPFELPEGWVLCRLGEIFNDLKYGTSQKCDYGIAKHAVLRIPNLSKGVIDLEDLKFANLPLTEFSNLKLEVNDMLVIRSNGSENLVGRTAVFKGAEFDCAYAGYLMRLRFHAKLLSVDYIHQVLESRYIRNLIEFPLRTTSGVKNINNEFQGLVERYSS